MERKEEGLRALSAEIYSPLFLILGVNKNKISLYETKQIRKIYAKRKEK